MTRHGGVHQGRTPPRPRIIRSLAQRPIGRHQVRAIHLNTLQVGETGNQLRDVPAGGLLFHWHGYGIAVVFDQEHQRKILQAGRIHRFPKFAFAGCAFAAGNQGHFV